MVDLYIDTPYYSDALYSVLRVGTWGNPESYDKVKGDVPLETDNVPLQLGLLKMPTMVNTAYCTLHPYLYLSYVYHVYSVYTEW